MLPRLISVNKMLTALRNHEVKRGEFIAYALLFVGGAVATVVTYVLEFLYGFSDIEQTYKPWYLHSVEFALFAIATIASIWVTYNINKNGDGKEFWYRFFCISFPISVRITVIAIIAAILLAQVGIINADYSTYVDSVFLAVFYMYNVYLLSHFMRIIATPTASEETVLAVQSDEVA